MGRSSIPSWVRSLALLVGSLLLFGLVIGCAQPTELVLVVAAEPRLTVGRVVVDVYGSGRGQRAETTVGTEGAPSLPLTLGVVPQREGVSDVTFHIAASVREGEGGAEVTLLRVVRTRFVPGSARMVLVTLSASCIGHVCADGEGCDLEGCVPNDVPGDALPGWSGTAPSSDALRCSMRDELCNGFDDDCDGTIDEGIDFASSQLDCGRCGQQCESGTCQEGLCAGERVTHVAAGGAHACVVRSNGTIACWGANHERQSSALGDVIRATPTTQPGVGFEEVTAGVDHTCAVTTDGRASCVGNGSTGALGVGLVDRSQFVDYVATAGAVTSLEAGAGFTAATVNGRIFLWGTFDGTTSASPVEMPYDGVFTRVAAGTRHFCGLLSDGTVACAGANDHGQLGRGDMLEHDELAAVPGLDEVSALAAGRDVTCALRTSGAVLCWGANDFGQLGAAGPARATPATVPGLGAARAIDVARAGVHACAVVRDGSVACWGDNSSAALGDGTTTSRSGVISVRGVSGATEVACGGFGEQTGFTCALLAAGGVACWGADDLGQCGDGDPGLDTLAPHWTIGVAPR